jgi:hypothetical protein
MDFDLQDCHTAGILAEKALMRSNGQKNVAISGI